MASIETRMVGKPPEPVYYVRFRIGGKRLNPDGTPAANAGERFTDHGLAKKFQADVEYHKHQYPPNYLPGIGYVTEAQMAAALAAATPSDTEPAYTPVLFRDRAEAYITARSGIEERTRYDYRRDVSNHMDGPFGDIDLRDPGALTTEMISTWVNTLGAGTRDPGDPSKWARGKEPKKAKTVANLHGLLYAIVQSAVDNGMRTINPCVKTDLPRLDGMDGDDDEDGEEMVFLTHAEFEILYGWADPAIRPLLLLMVGSGLRFSEITALKVRDLQLHLPIPTVRVRRAWKRQAPDKTVRKEERGDYYVLGPPKSAAGRRTVSISRELADLIARVTRSRDFNGFVFLNPSGEPWRHANFYNRYWQPLTYFAVRCDMHRREDLANGVRYRHKLTRDMIRPCGCEGTLMQVPRVHDMRHTFAAWQIAANVPLSKLRETMGHESYETTERRYGHRLPELDSRQSDATSAALAGILPPAL